MKSRIRLGLATTVSLLSMERRRVYDQVGTRKARLLSQWLEQPKLRVLEVGCGTAGFFEPFDSAGHDYVGLDLDPRMASAAVSRGARVHCIDLYDFTDDPFDAVLFSQVLEHALEPERFLRHVARVLRPGGIAVCDVPNHDSLAGYVARLPWPGSRRYGAVELPHHALGYTEGSLRHAFQTTFDDVRTFCTASTDPLWGQASILSAPARAYHLVSRVLQRPSLVVATGRRKPE